MTCYSYKIIPADDSIPPGEVEDSVNRWAEYAYRVTHTVAGFIIMERVEEL